MKKLIALGLLLCTLLAVVPAFMMAASGNEAVPAAKTPTYDDLYVTEGRVAHLVADEASVDLENGTWTS